MTGLVSISKQVEFDAGHRVPNHESKCRNPHGHRYKVIAHCIGRIVEEPGAPDEGMLVDFGILKYWLTKHVHDELDHGFIVHEGDLQMLDVFGLSNGQKKKSVGWKIIVFPYIPTAENIARWVYETINPLVNGHFRNNLTLEAIEIWETPTSMAKYPTLPTHL